MSLTSLYRIEGDAWKELLWERSHGQFQQNEHHADRGGRSDLHASTNTLNVALARLHGSHILRIRKQRLIRNPLHVPGSPVQVASREDNFLANESACGCSQRISLEAIP